MSAFSQIKKGRVQRPHLVLLYGVDGVGKTTFGAQSTNPIFLGPEDGSSAFDVARFPSPKSWQELLGNLADLAREKHEFKTLVIDSIDWCEPLLHDAICAAHNVKSIELAAGGYGKGYVEAVNHWIAFTKALTAIRAQRGMNIVLIGHSQVVRFSDPGTQSEYDRFELKLYKKSSAILREYVDSVLFANFEVHPKKDGQKTRAYGDGTRVVYTERRPGFDAKNRFGLPFVLPLSWDDFDRAVSSDRSLDPKVIAEKITELLTQVTDENLRAQVIKTMEGADATKLSLIKNRLEVRLNQ